MLRKIYLKKEIDAVQKNDSSTKITRFVKAERINNKKQV